MSKEWMLSACEAAAHTLWYQYCQDVYCNVFVIGRPITGLFRDSGVPPEGLGVTGNNDSSPDALCQADLLLWVWRRPCSTSSACHFSPTEKKDRRAANE